MKVFISWSGDQSQFVAEALRGWLQDVIQLVEPYPFPECFYKGILPMFNEL